MTTQSTKPEPPTLAELEAAHAAALAAYRDATTARNAAYVVYDAAYVVYRDADAAEVSAWKASDAAAVAANAAYWADVEATNKE